MQAVVELPDMAEKSAQHYEIKALRDNQQKLTDRVDKFADRVSDLSRQIGNVEGRLNAPAPHAWVLNYLIPGVLVLAISGGIGEFFILQGHIAKIESFLQNNEGFITSARLQHDAADPNDPKKIEDVRSALELARSRKIKIEATTVRQTGAKFVAASNTSPYAWQAALAFFAYHSLLNESALPGYNQVRLPTATFSAHFDAGDAFKEPLPPASWYGQSRPPNVAEMHPLSKPNVNAGKQFGFQYIFITGGTVTIDGMLFKRIVFKNSHVIYRGGDVDLDMVYFINCTFDVIRNPRGIDFGERLLASSATTFKPMA